MAGSHLPALARRPLPTLLAGAALVMLAACASPPQGGHLINLGGIEPAAGAGAADDAQLLLSAVITGDLLVGGQLGEQLAHVPPAEPAAGPVIDGDGDMLDRQLHRQSAFERLATEQQRQRQAENERALLFESWMHARIEPAPTERSSVRRAQQLLITQGYLQGPADGIFGPQTRAAIERFEASQELPRTGIVSPRLLERLSLEL